METLESANHWFATDQPFEACPTNRPLVYRLPPYSLTREIQSLIKSRLQTVYLTTVI